MNQYAGKRGEGKEKHNERGRGVVFQKQSVPFSPAMIHSVLQLIALILNYET